MGNRSDWPLDGETLITATWPCPSSNRIMMIMIIMISRNGEPVDRSSCISRLAHAHNWKGSGSIYHTHQRRECNNRRARTEITEIEGSKAPSSTGFQKGGCPLQVIRGTLQLIGSCSVLVCAPPCTCIPREFHHPGTFLLSTSRTEKGTPRPGQCGLALSPKPWKKSPMSRTSEQ